MKTHLLLLVCLALAGCGRQDDNNHEVLSRLDAIKSELAAKQAAPVRWATANRTEIMIAITAWSSGKMNEIKKTDALSPEIEEKFRHYQTLESEFGRAQMTRRMRTISAMPGYERRALSDEEFLALSNKVVEAREPVAELATRRQRQNADFQRQFSIEKLIGEYARGRFDLVLDSNEKPLFRSPSEVPDITQGVIALLNEKTKQ